MKNFLVLLFSVALVSGCITFEIPDINISTPDTSTNPGTPSTPDTPDTPSKPDSPEDSNQDNSYYKINLVVSRIYGHTSNQLKKLDLTLPEVGSLDCNFCRYFDEEEYRATFGPYYEPGKFSCTVDVSGSDRYRISVSVLRGDSEKEIMSDISYNSISMVIPFKQ